MRRYIKKEKENIIPKYSGVPRKMAKAEFLKIIKFLGKFWYRYQFTEHSYHGLAYQKMKKTGKPTVTVILAIISGSPDLIAVASYFIGFCVVVVL